MGGGKKRAAIEKRRRRRRGPVGIGKRRIIGTKVFVRAYPHSDHRPYECCGSRTKRKKRKKRGKKGKKEKKGSRYGRDNLISAI